MEGLSINIRIGDKEYPMKVRAKEEKLLRKAEKQLNKRISDFQNRYGMRDTQDLLNIVAFDCLVEKLKYEESSEAFNDTVLNTVIRLNQLLSAPL